MKAKFNLIIDSCCDFPIELLEKEGVFLFKFPYCDSEGEKYDDMYQTHTAHEFFESMRKGECPYTAQIAPATFMETYERATDDGMPAVYLSFSSGLSGSYDSACMMRDTFLEKFPDRELYVVDTKLGSIAEGLLAYEAIRQRDHGLSAKELVDWASEALYYIEGMFMVDDLTALQRGGRIPQSVALAGAKLDVKPLLAFSLDGRLVLKGVARGRRKGLRQFVECFEEKATNHDVENIVIITDADTPKDADKLRDYISKADERALVIGSSIGPVIGSHVGPGMMAICFWSKDRREVISVADRIARKIKRS